MNNIFEEMEKMWGDEKEPESTTFESSEKIEFENTSGLPKKYLNMSIGELVRLKGGVSGLKEWSMILKNLITADKIDQDMRERRNQTIEKDFVISNIIKYINIFMDGMFDLIESQNRVIISSVKADALKAEKSIPEMRKKAVTKLSKETKKTINNSLKRLSKKYDDPNA